MRQEKETSTIPQICTSNPYHIQSVEADVQSDPGTKPIVDTRSHDKPVTLDHALQLCGRSLPH